ncbi:MAG: EFR1 family ferrodoxin [Methanobrevibacter sp.]|nr:EFR1 family ferrodoxin [Methanobrevibacter sp.]
MDLTDEEYFGIITPTYFGGLPKIVEEYVSQLKITGNPYTYIVSTYGTDSGASTKIVEKYLDGLTNAKFNLQMPDTWTPSFDLSTPEKIAKFTQNTEKDLQTIITNIVNKNDGNFVHKEMPIAITKLSYKLYDKSSKTDNFTVEDTCRSCGLCVKSCPINALELKDDKPAWIKEKCLICLRCLHRCPEFSIQYKDKTKNHGQYTHPEIKKFD